MVTIHSLGLVLAFYAAGAFGDTVSGKITDIDDDAPLAGVKIGIGETLSTLSGADGGYSLDAGSAGLSKGGDISGLGWDAASGSFRWDGSHGAVALEIRDAAGNRVEGSGLRFAPGADGYRVGPAVGIRFVSLATGRGTYRFRMIGIGGRPMVFAAGGTGTVSKPALAKAAAVDLTFEKSGYATVTRRAEGNAVLDVRLKKTASARKANLTWYESYPDPGSEECVKYNGCVWAGQFAALDGQQPESWVKENNIAAVHEKDFAAYKLKTLRLMQGTRQIDVKVYDMCADSDCDGCCTENAGAAGFLIDVEKYTAERFGTRSGVVDWICLDCKN